MRFGTGSHPKAADTSLGMPASLALLPQSVVAFGGPQQPIDRLIGLQSVMARGVHALASIGQLWPRLRDRPALLRRQPGHRLAAVKSGPVQ